jgi:hypothetical protein
MLPNELASAWRMRAKDLREWGAEAQAIVIERCADEHDQWRIGLMAEPLTLKQAAAESGFSYSTLQQKVAAGEITNVGAAGSPLVRRGDIGRKCRPARFEPGSGEPDLATERLVGSLSPAARV